MIAQDPNEGEETLDLEKRKKNENIEKLKK